MNFVSLIEKKKLGQELTDEEISFFANRAGDGGIPDYQLAAMLMAIRLNGMSRRETAALTIAMEKSGDECDLSSLPGIPVDKHSTGGVGDTTTLVLAPLVASCGGYVAKMSGRGLGHTGGTLDKLESIPGFSVTMTQEQFLNQLRSIGVAVIGQTGNLAPADKTLYALRDVTSTVDSLPLIASSIISKKLASGSRGIVLDVKTGEGALMKTEEESIALAQTMVRIGCDAGRRMVALITDMDQPLGTHIGNALEVKEAIDILSGRAAGPLLDVSLELGSRMLMLADIANDLVSAKALLLESLRSGKGLRKLQEMIRAQGGDPSVCEDTGKLPQAHILREVPSPASGYITCMNTVALGNTAQAMGAGRRVKTDVIDPSVGFVLHKRVGDAVAVGESLATLHARDEITAAAALSAVRDAIVIGPEKPELRPLIRAFITKDTIERY